MSELINRIRILDTNTGQLVRCFGISHRLSVTNLNGERTYHLSDIEEVTAKGGSKDSFVASDAVFRCVSELLRVNGVFWVLVRAFEIIIKIENAFDWADVQDEIIAIMKRNLFGEVEVDVQDRTKRARQDQDA